MKKLILSVAVLSAICFTSCRKSYTCECETNSNPSVVNKRELSKQALKDARAECDKSDVNGSIECEIKL